MEERHIRTTARKAVRILILLAAVWISGGQNHVDAEKPEKELEAEIDEILSGMTRKEKIGQMFMVKPEALGATAEVNRAMKANYKKYPVGGINLKGNNIETPKQLKTFTKNIQKLSSKDVPMLIATDEEGGWVAELAENPNYPVKRYPSMRKIGDSGSAKKAMKAAENMGAYLKKYGINCDLAPVADIASNPDNEVIGNRSFGRNAGIVSKMVKAQVKDKLYKSYIARDIYKTKYSQ